MTDRVPAEREQAVGSELREAVWDAINDGHHESLSGVSYVDCPFGSRDVNRITDQILADVVVPALASSEAEVRRKVAAEIDAFADRHQSFIEEHQLDGYGPGNYATALRKAAKTARGGS